ncbi:MAG: extracellular solute-binding protein [Clostridiales bacterium]|nr:extracellular solute-binding protein [Clostridiales bacterium]
MNLFYRKNRTISFILLTLMLILLTSCSNAETNTDSTKTDPQVSETVESFSEEETKPVEMNLWYTNELLEAYFNEAARVYGEENNVLVTPKLVSTIDYLESINKSNIEKNSIVDVYILNSESIEKAYLAGLALENDANVYSVANYPRVALSASTYQNKLVGYPLYFDTAFFLYNKSFVEEAPKTFAEIIEFSQTFESSEYEGVEGILWWDVRDLYFNYAFAGAHLELGGVNGDDRSIVDINNEEVINALTSYKYLNQKLYFDTEGLTYNTVLQKFLEGKLIYTLGSSRSLKEIEAAEIDYGIAVIPDLLDGVETKGISINYVAVVNPYTEDEDYAKDLAKFISYDFADSFYSYTGRISSKRNTNYENPEWAHVIEQYETTATMPKLMETTNFWVELEVAMNNIWNATLNEGKAGEASGDAEKGFDESEEEVLQRIKEEVKGIVTDQMTKVQDQMVLQLQ